MRCAPSLLALRMFYQMTRITKERGALKHDDRLDALAMAVAYWVEHTFRRSVTDGGRPAEGDGRSEGGATGAAVGGYQEGH